MQEKQLIDTRCIRIEGESRILKKERLATESILNLIINGNFEASFSYTKGFEKQLVLGYLISSGIINDLKKIISIESTNFVWKISLSSDKKDNSRETLSTSMVMTFSHLQEAREILLRNQPHHRATRGFHAAIMFEPKTGKWFACEDIGRYNAVDKVIGHLVDQGEHLFDCLLLTTGRLTASTVSKGKNAGIPVVASMTVATDRAIQMAVDNNITLIGGLTAGACWLYNEGRVKVTAERDLLKQD